MKRNLLFFLAFCISFNLFAQGSLMLVGGGGEVDGGWSNPPYQWCVSQSKTKKVAIITATTAGATAFIPDYFKKLGAIHAKNFIIDSKAVANAQATYDSLKQYDCVFIKGGDQSLYYNYFKGTKTQTALQEIFNNGGVLSGTSAGAMILSSIIYTAEKGSIYPDEILSNLNHDYMTLKNDFLNVMPKGWIVETHTAQRGRLNRIVGMMGHWDINKNEISAGLAIDDQTAICIDKNLEATVYGTGAVAIVEQWTANSFDKTAPFAASNRHLNLRQYVQPTTFKFSPKAIGSNAKFKAAISHCDYFVMSGSDLIEDNNHVINHLVNKVGSSSDAILVIHAANFTEINNWKNKIIEKGANNITTMSNWNNEITLSNFKKIVFLNLSFEDFNQFMTSKAGIGVYNAIKQSKIIPFYIGSSSQCVGNIVCTNTFTDKDAAYKGELKFEKNPFSITQNVGVVANTYLVSTSNFYENTQASLLYSLVKDSLSLGFWLTGTAAAEIKKDPKPNSYGHFIQPLQGSTLPIVRLNNCCMHTRQFSTLAAAGNAKPRNIVGFSQMNIDLLNSEKTYHFGNFLLSVSQKEIQEQRLKLDVFPNPSSDFISFDAGEDLVEFQLYNIFGQLVFQKDRLQGQTTIDINHLAKGIYLAVLKSKGKVYQSNIIKH